MTRRLSPAMATCATVGQRLHDLSERVAQASNLLSTRVDIAREVLAPYPNVEVQGFSCLLMEFLRQNNARVILRGEVIRGPPTS